MKERAAHTMRGAIKVEFSALLYFYWDFSASSWDLWFMACPCGTSTSICWSGGPRYGQVVFALALWFVVIGPRDRLVDAFVRGPFMLAPVGLVFALARSRRFASSDVAAIDPCGRGIAR